MPSLPLLHSFPGNPIDAKGLQRLGNTIPRGWEPEPNTYDPAAFPTPFGRAEATALVLRTGTLGVHRLFDEFKWLLLGVVSGVLRVVPDDLVRLDNLGRALMLVDPEARYFSRIVWGTSGPATVFGMTYRTCLFWSHARREDSDWSRLRSAVEPRMSIALTLLDQWRKTLQSSGRWNAQLVQWQRAVDLIIDQGGAAGGSDVSLRADTVNVGPIAVLLPTGEGAQSQRAEWLYVPSYDPGRLGRFRSLLQANPTQGPEGLVLLDPSGAVRARISTLPQVTTDGKKIAAGVGSVEVVDGTPVAGGGPPRTDEVRRFLEPVQRVLSEEGRAIDDASVRRQPWAYPDALRLLAFVSDSVPEGAILSNRAHMACVSGAMLPDEAGDDLASLPVGTQRIILVDRIDAMALHELRGLGLLLYRVFVGEVSLRQGAFVPGSVPSSFAEAAEPFAAPSKNPLEPAAWVTALVSKDPPLALVKRLATLQRFVATYANAEPILAKAARSFAKWAADRELPIAPMGRAASRTLGLTVAGQSLLLGQDSPPAA
jgi:hypothetical protein